MTSERQPQHGSRHLRAVTRAILYSRVSTDAQESDGTSLTTQEDAARRYAEAHGYQVIRSIRDTASGFRLDRPGMDEVRELLRERAADVVVAHAVDRVSRNQNHTGVVFDEVERAGARLEFVTERFEDTAVGRFILAARAFVAEVEREKIVERTSRGRLHSAQRGTWVGPMPFGYSRPEKGVIAVDEDQARIVRRIYDLYLDHNLGVTGIARVLNAEGARTLKGVAWAGKQVRDVLQNETYSGVMVYAQTRFPDRAPVIIPRDRWEAAQERRRRKLELRGGRTHISPFLLTGVLFCGECGGRMAGISRSKRQSGRRFVNRDYECSRWRRGIGCGPNRHRAAPLDEAVTTTLNEVNRAQEIEDALAQRRYQRLQDDLAATERSLAKNDAKRRRVAQAIMDDVFVGPQARMANEEVEAERKALEAEAARIEAELNAAAQAARELSARPQELRMLLDTTLPIPQRKAIIQRYVRRIVVYDGQPEPVFEE